MMGIRLWHDLTGIFYRKKRGKESILFLISIKFSCIFVQREENAMPRRNNAYDSVFKSMKSKHKRLFISVINEVFGKNYPLDATVDVLPSEGYLTESETTDGSKKLEERISDFVIKLENEIYLIECQSYDDGSMSIRIAEYAFIVARQFAEWDAGRAIIPMPKLSIFYVKSTGSTPKKTTITFLFPDGQNVDYVSDNVILDDLTKEEIIEKRLFPFIPFYIARYEKELTSEMDTEAGNTSVRLENAIKDLEYFRDEMLRLHEEKELKDDEIVDLMGLTNTIITHITDGNKNEKRMVNVMGGAVLELESEKLIRKGEELGRAEGKAEAIIELMSEDLKPDDEIIETLQKRVGIAKAEAVKYLKRYREKNNLNPAD
jgi:hypothetical protein